MAGETRLELAAFAVTGRRYNQLNYSPAEWLELADYTGPGKIRQGKIGVKSK